MFNRAQRLLSRLDLVERGFRGAGAATAIMGLSHFAAPRVFEAITRPVFPEDTANWVKVNGTSEAVIGFALIDRRTRLLGLVGLVVYGVHLGERAGTAVVARLRENEAISAPSFAD
ncbi:hypothetical protein [Gordonia effusa]|nr:hypothetical protein [Gordonia effusa]